MHDTIVIIFLPCLLVIFQLAEVDVVLLVDVVPVDVYVVVTVVSFVLVFVTVGEEINKVNPFGLPVLSI